MLLWHAFACYSVIFLSGSSVLVFGSVYGLWTRLRLVSVAVGPRLRGAGLGSVLAAVAFHLPEMSHFASPHRSPPGACKP